MPGSTVIRFDVSDVDLRRDPYPTYRLMREHQPVWKSPEGITYFTRYADCVDMLRHPWLSYDLTNASTFGRSLSEEPAARAAQMEESRRSRSLLNSDPPDHTRLRSLVNRAFTPQSVEESRPAIVEYVDALLDGVVAAGRSQFDLVSEFSAVLPIFVICSMMNIPVDDRQGLIAISSDVTRSIDPDVPLDVRFAAQARLRDYIADLVAARRPNLGDDLMSRLIAAFADGRIVDEHELLTTTAVLLIAGFETTATLITNSIYRLLANPAQLDRLRSEPSRIATAIEETLRFDPPLQFLLPRAFVAESEVGGVVFAPGDPVVPLLAAANRDPAEFDDPEVFDIARQVNRNLAFGVGHHRCIGSTLARIEAQIAVLRVIERFGDLALAADPEPEYRPNLMMRGFAHLWVTAGGPGIRADG